MGARSCFQRFDTRTCMSIPGNISALAGYNPVQNGRSRLLLIGAITGCLGSITLAAAATSVSPIMALVVVIGLIAAVAMLTSSTLCAVVLCFSLPFERIGRF